MKKFTPFLFAICLLLAGVNSFATAPKITKFTPDSGAVGSLVTITGTALSSPTEFTIGGVSAIVISGTATKLVGMVMPGAVTGTVSVTTSGGTATTNTEFKVKPTPYPNQQQGNKLVGRNTTGGGTASQGYSVAVSADGSKALVGGPQLNGWSGAAWVYTRTGAKWKQQGDTLVGKGAAGSASFGTAVALSADGNTAAVGGYTDNGSAGATWIFTYASGVWTQQGNKLVGTGGVGIGDQGRKIALSANGNTLIEGGEDDNSGVGAVWVFTRTGNTWTQQGNKLVGTGAVGPAYQGDAVAISADGNTAIVGGFEDNNQIGAAWVYVRTGSVWSQQGSKLVGTGYLGNPYQGTSVAISADGNTVLVGGFFDDIGVGATWVFTRTGTTWAQQGNKLVATGYLGEPYEGSTVALSADGNTALISGPYDTIKNGHNVGETWAFTRSGSTWKQRVKIMGTGYQGAEVIQGYAIALSTDGSTAIFGGPDNNDAVGASWIFVAADTETDAPVVIQNSYKNGDAAENPASTDINQPFNVLVYPNPFTNNFHMVITGSGDENINIKIYNINGQVVYSSDIAGNDGGTVGAKNLSPELGSNLANGMYLVQVTQGANSKVIRMVKTE